MTAPVTLLGEGAAAVSGATNGSSTSHVLLDESNAATTDTIPCHPLGVKPSGNGLTATWDLRGAIGTFAILPDELILVLLENLDSTSLLNIGQTCKALYAFTRSEDLWKALFIQSPRTPFSWQGTWRSTYLNLAPSQEASLDCSHLFSDTLHRPFYCAHISLEPYFINIPSRNQITRLKDLSPEEFQESWSDRPFILTEPVKEWPVYRNWSTDSLLKAYGDTVFRAEAVDWPLKTYVEYMRDNSDESPLYLFDRGFVSKMNIEVGDYYASSHNHSTEIIKELPATEAGQVAYWPPPCFGEDFFSLLEGDRPDNQWLIVGPERSGSTFHKDPNATSAWNAVIRGSKYWIMFPSSQKLPPPPGVYVSADQSEVTSPLSIAEWLLGFHAEARRTPGCIEGICGEGEVLHVPSGWWHLVVNLEPAIAITQNFIPRAHLTAALDFLKNKPDQVSGFRKDIEDPAGRFVEMMRERHPDLLEKALEEVEKKSEGRKRKWDELVRGKQNGVTNEEEQKAAAGFSFGFGDDGSDVEIP